jgi:hypothetical protein
MMWGAYCGREPVIRWHDVSANVEPSAFPQVKTRLVLLKKAPPVGFEPTLTAPEAANAIVRISSLTCVTFSAARRHLTDHSVNIPDHAVQGSCAGSS